jgi:DMSO/TMAO reductase YedYZ molybdopterin-dependent catalytic subunit
MSPATPPTSTGETGGTDVSLHGTGSPPRQRGRPPAWAGATAGLIAAGAGLAAGEVAAASGRQMRSPVVSVGNRVIDSAPPWLKDWAIDVFGTGDKAALLAGTIALLAGFAAGIGVLAARRHPAWGAGGVMLFGAAGLAAAAGEPTGGAARALPAVAATLTAGLVLGGLLLLLLRAADRDERAPTVTDPRAPAMSGGDRRRFLFVAGATAALAAATGMSGRWLQQRLEVARERAALVLPGAARPLPSPPRDPAGGIEGLSPLFTPNADFYRIDTALVVPRVSTDGWTLRVHGLVERELALGFDDLLDRPIVEADVTLACVSNEVGGRLVGNARWSGVRLDDLLDEAGVLPGADQVVGRSVDGFTAGFPVAALDGRDALVAVQMNGEPLPVDHGYPARLVVPGLYGYVSATKWLSDIELTTFDDFSGYWIPRGWSAEGPVLTQSRIDVPRDGARVPAGATVVAGVAWAPTLGIEEVEVRVDDGPWRTATLGPAPADTTWRQWWLDWDATPGEHRITVRATDGSGETQPEQRRPPRPSGATGWHGRTVRVERVE